MGRWEPDARGRLGQAALQLYRERGFDQTTVAEIAKRAGLTERTFFRHYADKREVLFAGSDALERHMIEALRAAPPTATPLQAVAAAIDAVGEVIVDREFSRLRQAVISANPELQERELVKLASLAAALGAALRERGVADPVASIAAEAGIAVFKVAFQQWIDGAAGPGLSDAIRASLAELEAVTAPSPRQ